MNCILNVFLNKQ